MKKAKPNMTVTASMDGKPFGTTQFKDFRDPEATFERPIENADVGRSTTMELKREGTGRIYYAARLSYALRDGNGEDINAGIEVHREYSMQHDDKWDLLTNRTP